MGITPGAPDVGGGKDDPTALDGVSFHGFIQEELDSDASPPMPTAGLPNAVTSEHHSQVIHNESGIVLPGGASMPSAGAPSISANEAEAGGPKMPPSN